MLRSNQERLHKQLELGLGEWKGFIDMARQTEDSPVVGRKGSFGFS